MGKLTVSEFSHLATAEASMGPSSVGFPIPQQPGLAVQEVTFDFSEKAESKPFNDKTRFVRVNTDTTCLIDFGVGGERWVANQTEYMGVRPGAKLTVIEVP